MYQVNITEFVDGSTSIWKSRFSEDGYKGILIDKEYSDGFDRTNWGVFTGSAEECDEFILNNPNMGLFG